jgi:GNAT superfamily N-acetyltransferase
MAKHRKHRKHRRGTGSVLQVRQLSGLGAMRSPNSIMGTLLPIGIGAVVGGGAMIGIRSFMHPDTPLKQNLMEYAPWVGLAAGGVAGLALWNMSSQHAGLLAFGTAAVIAVTTVTGEAVAKARLTAEAAGAGTKGLSAIVPEYRRTGTGAILMERAGTSDAQRGANIQLQGLGLGKINTSAFGVPGFSVGN